MKPIQLIVFVNVLNLCVAANVASGQTRPVLGVQFSVGQPTLTFSGDTGTVYSIQILSDVSARNPWTDRTLVQVRGTNDVWSDPYVPKQRCSIATAAAFASRFGNTWHSQNLRIPNTVLKYFLPKRIRGFGPTNETKELNMQTTMNRIHSPAKAKAYFEDKLAFTTGPVELERWMKTGEDNLVVVDVRAEEDFAKGHIPGAINVPRNKWGSPQGLSRDKTNVVYCYTQQCHLAANACVQFAGQGYPVMELEGGFECWKEHELDIEEQAPHRYKTAPEHMAGRH